MLSEVFERFVEASPVTVMMRGLLERALNAEYLDRWFEQTVESQHTRELLFSTVFGLMLQVVCGVRKALCGAYQALVEAMPVSIQSVYNKLQGIEPKTAAKLVRFAAGEARGLIEELGAERAEWLSGYRVKILDGNCLEASEHRLKELREVGGGALLGKALVVYEPGLDVVVDVVPCENGHTQERALLGTVLSTVAPGEVWVGDGNFCVLSFLLGIERRDGYFVVRGHEQLRWWPLNAMQDKGPSETGRVAEQAIAVSDEAGQKHRWRRIRVCLNTPTRDGDDTLYLLTNLPKTVHACLLARLYCKRWTIETAFQQVEWNFNSEINTLAYPRAALFGFCVALVAYNTPGGAASGATPGAWS